MKIKQEERKKKTPKRKKKQQQQKRPSRSGQRKTGQTQSYKVHMLAAQAKDIRIKDLEAELADTKTGRDWTFARLDQCKIGFLHEKSEDECKIGFLEAELAAMKERLLVEQQAKLEAMAMLESWKKQRDKSDALAIKLFAKKVPGSWKA